LGRQFGNLVPFASAARTSLINLGNAAQQSQSSLVATLPLAKALGAAGTAAKPTAANLQKLLSSLQTTGGIQQLMNLLFNGAVAGNGFDSLGHYVRDESLDSSCTNYVTKPVAGCSANFAAARAGAASVSSESSATAKAPAKDTVVSRAVASVGKASPTGASMQGLLSYLVGSGQ
jgi:hypothetical protein